jgi:uncharacterized delta-60 repeat protein
VTVDAAPNNNSDVVVARMTPSGVMDDTFGDGGVTVDDLYGSDEYAAAVTVQPNNRIIVTGDVFEGLTDDTFAVRYLTTGLRDTSFSGGGGDGYFSTTGVTAFDAYLDSSTGVGLGAGGTVLVVGTGYNGSEYTTMVIRLTSSGDFDPTFDDDGIVLMDTAAGFERAYTATTDSQGRVVVGGSREATDGGSLRAAVFRFLSNGDLDSGFGASGMATIAQADTTVSLFGLVLQRDGKIVVTGTSTAQSVSNAYVARLSKSGALDPTFSGDGKNVVALSSESSSWGLAMQRTGRLLAVGQRDSTPQVPLVEGMVGDATPPSKARLRGVHRWELGKASVRWSATDDNTGVKSYAVQRRAAAYTKAKYGAWSLWKSTTTKSAAFTGKQGHTYCVRARAKDFAGNVGSFGATKCLAVPLDERMMSVHGSWGASSNAGYYRDTALSSTVDGASLTLSGARWRHLAVVVTTCPSCGSLDVYLGTKLLRTLDLSSPLRHSKVMAVAGKTKVQSGDIRLVVRGGGPVTVEGVGVSLA